MSNRKLGRVTSRYGRDMRKWHFKLFVDLSLKPRKNGIVNIGSTGDIKQSFSIRPEARIFPCLDH